MSTKPPIATKPPIGIMPEFVYRENRIDDLRNAIRRYRRAGIMPPPQWADELFRLRKAAAGEA